MKEVTGLEIVGNIYDNKEKIEELRNSKYSRIYVSKDTKVSFSCEFGYLNFHTVICMRNEKERSMDLESDSLAIYYIFEVLVYILKELGGVLEPGSDYEQPKWASMKWTDKKWWERIPH